MTLPISRVMSRAYSSFRAISSSAALYSISARRGAGTRRHFLKAWRAASMAWSTSSLADFWKMPTTSRVSAGFRFSKVRPVRVSTHSPAMKFLKILGFATAPMLADVCSIVAIRLSSPANCKPSMLSGGWRLVIPGGDDGWVHHGGTDGTGKVRGLPEARALLLRVIPLARLHSEVFVGGGQRDLVIASSGDSFVGGVAQAVLVAQFLFDLGIDLIDRFFLGHLEETSASFSRDLLQDFLAVGMRGLLRVSTAAGTAAHSATTPTAVAAHASHAGIALVAVSVGIGVQDGVHQGVGALGRLDGPVQTDSGASVNAIGKND